MVKFMEKIALITGGTSGIGLECAKKFLVNKINVILVGRNKDKYIEAKKYLKSLSQKMYFAILFKQISAVLKIVRAS